MGDLVAIIPVPICYAGRGKGIEARPHRPEPVEGVAKHDRIVKPGITFSDEAKAGIACRDSSAVLFLPPLGEGVANGPSSRGERVGRAGE
jgi:hypothetical protein